MRPITLALSFLLFLGCGDDDPVADEVPVTDPDSGETGDGDAPAGDGDATSGDELVDLDAGAVGPCTGLPASAANPDTTFGSCGEVQGAAVVDGECVEIIGCRCEPFCEALHPSVFACETVCL